ncbi:MAG: hypothetical protein R3B13_23260 [Polyangiaceae bacterium]
MAPKILNTAATLGAAIFLSACSSGSGGGGAAACADGGTCPPGTVCGSSGFCEPIPGSGGATGSGGFGAFGSGGSGAGGFGAFGSGGTGSGGFGAFGGTSGQGGGSGYCGDGATDPGEECDDGGDSANCDKDCTYASCGDSTYNPAAGEDCDTGGDSSACNYDCTPAKCGDGYTNASAGESCDDGGESSYCNPNCTFAKCGDGILNKSAGEACDDGGVKNGDGCSSTCTIELPSVGEDCASAVALNLGPNTINWSAKSNDYLTSTPSCSSSGVTGPDVVFTHTATATGTLDIVISKPTSTRWVATTSTGTCGIGAVQTSCVSDFSLSSMSTTLSVTAGTKYYLYLADTTSGTNPLSNPVTITLTQNTASTSGENCSSAIPITLGSNTINWTASAKDYVPSIPTCLSTSYSTTGPDVVLSYTAASTGTRTFTVSKPTSTRWVAIVNDGTCGAGLSSALACVTEYTNASMSGSVYMYSGSTYYFYLVDTTSGTLPLSNPFTITLN